MNRYLRIFIILFCFCILFQTYKELSSHANFLPTDNKKMFLHAENSIPKPKLTLNYNANIEKFANTKEEDNYLKHAANANGQLNKWKNENILIHIPKGEHYQTVLSAFERYQEVLGGVIKFIPTLSFENADITIRFTNQLEAKNDDTDTITGLTTTTVDKQGNIKRAEIKISTTDYVTNKKLMPQDIYTTSLHEIAHALGIVGHSPNPNDIMFASSKSIQKLSERDINTLKLLYCNNNGEKIIQNTQLKLKEALDYTDKYPQKSISWLNLGKVYYDLNKKEEALNAYQKALTIDTTNSSIYQLMALCYFEDQNYEQSIRYYRLGLQTACDKRTQIEISEIIGINYLKMKDFKTAYEYLKTAFNASPYERNYLNNYLLSCIELDRKLDAQTAILKFFSIEPKSKTDSTLNEILDWAS